MEIITLMQSEILLTGIILLLLVLKLADVKFSNEQWMHAVSIGLSGLLLVGFLFSATGNAFGDMFISNDLLRLEKNILVLGTLIVSMQAGGWLKNHEHVPEFFILLLTSLLGMFFMLSAGNLLMFFLGLEMSTLPIAALANFDLQRRRSSEAAMKMIISSAFASGILLFGISWVYGTTGSIGFASITQLLTGSPLQIFALVLLLAGFGFKISAVPFHLWTADVYEGSPLPVTSFLSVVSKGAVVFVLISVLYKVFGSMETAWYQMLVLISIATMLIGNLFALRQTQIKRFLAFSSIAQIGFILVAVSGASNEGAASGIFFILVYLFSNLAAFGVVSLISFQTGKENIDDYKGLRQSNPVLAWVLAIALFSLAGVPPMAGFFGKFFLIIAGAGKGNWLLIVIAVLNMIISMAYYLRVVKVMFMDTTENPLEKIAFGFSPRLAMVICVGGILVTGIASGAYGYVFRLVSGE
jgi:NADH-quinone oxidoreductase subunit N